MRESAASPVVKRLILCGLLLTAIADFGQNQPPTNNHVVLPNPTPRDPDLKEVYENDISGQRKAQVQSLQSQLRAREIWLESNQILLLAQQLQEGVGPGSKTLPMSMNAAKVAKIEKLARSVEDKMKNK